MPCQWHRDPCDTGIETYYQQKAADHFAKSLSCGYTSGSLQCHHEMQERCGSGNRWHRMAGTTMQGIEKSKRACAALLHFRQAKSYLGCGEGDCLNWDLGRLIGFLGYFLIH